MNMKDRCLSRERGRPARKRRTGGPSPEARLIVHAGGTPALPGRAAPRMRRSRGSGIAESKSGW